MVRDHKEFNQKFEIFEAMLLADDFNIESHSDFKEFKSMIQQFILDIIGEDEGMLIMRNTMHVSEYEDIRNGLRAELREIVLGGRQ